MQKFISSTITTIIFFWLLAGFQSHASADGLYFGGGVYISEAEYQTVDDTDETLALLIGYNFIDSGLVMFSMELGAYDLGEYSDNGVNIDADAIGLAAVGTLPLGPFIELYAKVGSADVNIEINNDTFDGTETFQGAGVSLDIFDTIDFYLEYVEFDTEIDSRSIGLGVRFDLF